MSVYSDERYNRLFRQSTILSAQPAVINDCKREVPRPVGTAIGPADVLARRRRRRRRRGYLTWICVTLAVSAMDVNAYRFASSATRCRTCSHDAYGSRDSCLVSTTAMVSPWGAIHVRVGYSVPRFRTGSVDRNLESHLNAVGQLSPSCRELSVAAPSAYSVPSARCEFV